MTRLLLLHLIMVALGAWTPAMGQDPGLGFGDGRVRVTAAPAGPVAPGQRVAVAVGLRMAPGWHVYWTNPGDSGLPPRLTWTLPAGWTADAPRFPVPERHVEAGLVTFVYHGEVRLVAELAVPADAAGGRHSARVRVDYLVCREACVPGQAEVAVSIDVVAGAPAMAPDPSGFPAPAVPPGVEVLATRAERAIALTVRGDAVPALAAGAAPLMPALEGRFQLGAEQVVEGAAGQWRLRLPLSPGEPFPDRLAGIITGLPGAAGVAIDVPIAGLAPTAPDAPASAGATDPARSLPVADAAETTADAGAGGTTAPVATSRGLLAAILGGLVGGLILNLMPCVLPVLALKALAVTRARATGKPLLAPALRYAAGVIAAYLVLAAVLLVLRAGGAQVGWGFQLQQPAVVLALAGMFVLLAVNLAGAFEIGLSATRVDPGPAGSFFNGVLTTVVATPCGAPFVSAALAFALVAPAAQALAVFTALGVGLAAPVVLIAAVPAATRFLPKPGAWMEDLKRILAIPMLGAAGWMLWTFVALAGGEASFAVLVAGVPLLVLAAGAWGRFQGGGSRPALILAALACGGCLAVGGWAATRPRPAADPGSAQDGVGWQAWTPERQRALRDAGTPYLVDFTAAWCLTCQINKRTALHDAGIAADLARRGVARLRADFTGSDPAIGAALAALGRASVPTYVLHHEGRDTLLPDLLTPGIIRDAIAAIPVRTP